MQTENKKGFQVKDLIVTALLSLCALVMEDYLEAVLVLQQQKGYVRCVDVAELLDVKKPSVSRAVKELSKKKSVFSITHAI